jgi:hypothetical protein
MPMRQCTGGWETAVRYPPCYRSEHQLAIHPLSDPQRVFVSTSQVWRTIVRIRATSTAHGTLPGRVDLPLAHRSSGQTGRRCVSHSGTRGWCGSEGRQWEELEAQRSTFHWFDSCTLLENPLRWHEAVPPCQRRRAADSRLARRALVALHQFAKGLRSGSNPFLAALPSLHRCAAAALQQQQRPRWRRTPQRAPRGPRELMVAPSWPGVCSAVSIGSIDQVQVELFLLRHMQAVCRDLRSARLIVNVWPGAISD